MDHSIIEENSDRDPYKFTNLKRVSDKNGVETVTFPTEQLHTEMIEGGITPATFTQIFGKGPKVTEFKGRFASEINVTMKNVHTVELEKDKKTAVISDIHAHKTNFDQKVFEQIKQIVEANDNIILLGDIADLWVDSFTETKWFEELSGLFQTAIDQDKKIYFIHGNHDEKDDWARRAGPRTNQSTKLLVGLPVTAVCHELWAMQKVGENEYLPIKFIHGHQYSAGHGAKPPSIQGRIMQGMRVFNHIGITLGESIPITKKLRDAFGSFITLPHAFRSRVVESEGQYIKNTDIESEEQKRKYLVVFAHSHREDEDLKNGLINVGKNLPSNPLVEIFALINGVKLYNSHMQITDGVLNMKRIPWQKKLEEYSFMQRTQAYWAAKILASSLADSLIYKRLLSEPTAESTEKPKHTAIPNLIKLAPAMALMYLLMLDYNIVNPKFGDLQEAHEQAIEQ